MSLEAKLSVWQNDLIDMSRMNRLLYFSPGGRSISVSLLDNPEQLFARLRDSGRPYSIDPKKTTEPVDSERRLARLRTRAREAANDRGIHILYLAFGLLEWQESPTSTEVIRSPLLLVPVSLTRKGIEGAFQVARMQSEEIEINPTLRERLRHDFRLVLPAYQEVCDAATTVEGEPIDEQKVPLQQFFDAITTALASGGAEAAVASWRIASEVHLGAFSFQKLVMYQDLRSHADELRVHPVLRALGGEATLYQPADLVSAAQLDDRLLPHDSLEILDADSSQQEAIAAAKAGASFVLQGPPGTGKSQTIANIIAERMGQGKRVLFVSEKMAALEVVQQRLRDAGLGDFCLNLHSSKTDKKTVVADLKQAIAESDTAVAPASSSNLTWKHQSDDLLRVRSELNAYVRELHARRPPQQQSAFDAYAALAHLADVPDIDAPLPQVAQMTHAQHQQVLAALQHLSDFDAVLDRYDSYPWRETLLREYSLERESSIRHHYGRLLDALDRLIALAPGLRADLDEPTAALTFGWLRTAFERADLAAASPLPPARWLEDGVPQRLRSQAQPASQQRTRYLAARAQLLATYAPSVFDLDHTALLRALTLDAEHAMACLLPQRGTPQDTCLEQRTALDAQLERADVALGALSEATATLTRTCGLGDGWRLRDVPTLLEAARLLLATPKPPSSWLASATFAATGRSVREYCSVTGACRQARASLDAIYLPGFYALDLRAIALRFTDSYASLLRFVQPEYYSDMRALRAQMRVPQSRSFEQVRDDLQRALRLLDGEQWLRESAANSATLLGDFAAAPVDTAQVLSALEWATRLHATLPHGIPVEGVRLATGPERNLAPLRAQEQRLRETWAAWEAEADALAALVQPQTLLAGAAALDDVTPADLHAALAALHTTLQHFWQAAQQVAQASLAGRMPAWASLYADLRVAQEVRESENRLREQATTLAEDLGPFAAGLDTDWSAVVAALGWATALLTLYPLRQIPAGLRKSISAEGADAAARARLRTARAEGLDALAVVEEELRASDEVLPRTVLLQAAATLDAAEVSAVRTAVAYHRDELPCLERWIEYSQHYATCVTLRLGEFLTVALRDRAVSSRLVECFEKRFQLLWLDGVQRGVPSLLTFRSDAHEHAIARFRELDSSHLTRAQQRLRDTLLQQRRTALRSVRAQPMTAFASALTALRREVNKKRHRAIRQIVLSTAPALLALKPCWMMSPLSVSQYVASGEQLFDLVIFDEASQVCPEDAICAILRGEQVIVVGDSKQLPPTRFFARTLADETDEDEDESGAASEEQTALQSAQAERSESILAECEAANFARRALIWHYRSRHEALIAFSNAQFYGNSLVTFPSTQADSSAGVRFEYVADGIYTRGGTRQNVREAERVVDLIVQHMRRWGDSKTLGVVALSEAQQRAISESLRVRLHNDADLNAVYGDLLSEDSSSGFFIKNLESVQGDECDVILLSIGYGKDALRNRVSANFGPVTRAGGERRLNVAVTRAREQMVLVASFHANELPRELASPGMRALRDYMEYAERGLAATATPSAATAPRSGTTATLQFESPFEEAVYAALTARGLRLDTQVGCSGYRIDLAARDPRDPDRYLLGIECDGATYHSSATARDRDRLRQRHLEAMGWTIHRIWSREWLRDPNGQVLRVLDALAAAEAKHAAPVGRPALRVVNSSQP